MNPQPTQPGPTRRQLDLRAKAAARSRSRHSTPAAKAWVREYARDRVLTNTDQTDTSTSRSDAS